VVEVVGIVACPEVDKQESAEAVAFAEA